MSNQRTGRLKRGDSDDDTEGPQLFPDSHGTEKVMKKKQAFTSLRGPDIDDDGAWPPPPSHKASVATYDVPHFGGVTKEGTGEDMLTSGKQSSVAQYHGMAELEESETEDLPSCEESDNSKGVTTVSPKNVSHMWKDSSILPVLKSISLPIDSVFEASAVHMVGSLPFPTFSAFSDFSFPYSQSIFASPITAKHIMITISIPHGITLFVMMFRKMIISHTFFLVLYLAAWGP